MTSTLTGTKQYLGSIRIREGQRIRTFGGWYRHDEVFVGERKLEGTIQVRRRHGRIERTTGFGNSCVLGMDIQWLLKMNWINPTDVG